MGIPKILKKSFSIVTDIRNKRVDSFDSDTSSTSGTPREAAVQKSEKRASTSVSANAEALRDSLKNLEKEISAKEKKVKKARGKLLKQIDTKAVVEEKRLVLLQEVNKNYPATSSSSTGNLDLESNVRSYEEELKLFDIKIEEKQALLSKFSNGDVLNYNKSLALIEEISSYKKLQRHCAKKLVDAKDELAAYRARETSSDNTSEQKYEKSINDVRGNEGVITIAMTRISTLKSSIKAEVPAILILLAEKEKLQKAVRKAEIKEEKDAVREQLKEMKSELKGRQLIWHEMKDGQLRSAASELFNQFSKTRRKLSARFPSQPKPAAEAPTANI